MSTTDTINLSIPLDEKIQLEKIFSTYGLTINEAINLFIEASLEAKEFPFQLRYNKEMEEAIQEARDIISGKLKAKSYKTVEEMFTDIDKD